MSEDGNTPGEGRDGWDSDPVDLDRRPAGFSAQDLVVAAAFRAGLRPDDAQAQALLARLPEIQGRARRSYRRRQVALSGVLAVAATTAVILAVNLPGGRGTAAVTPAGGDRRGVATEAVTRDSLLQAGQITAFGAVRVKQDRPPSDLSGQALVAGVCVSGTPKVAVPDRAWTAGWQVAQPGAGDVVPGGLVETVWQWDTGQQGPADPSVVLLAELNHQVRNCKGPGKEGRGAIQLLDTATIPSTGIWGLVTTASDGAGNEQVQAVMGHDGTAVQVDVVLPLTHAKGGAKASTSTGFDRTAWHTVEPTVFAAMKDVFAQSVVVPTAPATPPASAS